jgi:hypothetical protein
MYKYQVIRFNWHGEWIIEGRSCLTDFWVSVKARVYLLTLPQMTFNNPSN